MSLERKCVSMSKFALVLLLGAHLVWAMPGEASSNDGNTVLASVLGSDSKTEAPDFELNDLKGTAVRLSSYKGQRPVLIYFWATWCPYCVAAKPGILKLRQEIDPKEMEIIGINVGGGDSLNRVKRFEEEHPSTFPILFDAQGKVSRSYGVQGIPLFVIVNKEGQEVYRGNSLPDNPMKYLK